VAAGLAGNHGSVSLGLGKDGMGFMIASVCLGWDWIRGDQGAATAAALKMRTSMNGSEH
jgi:hypothetical protein